MRVEHPGDQLGGVFGKALRGEELIYTCVPAEQGRPGLVDKGALKKSNRAGNQAELIHAGFSEKAGQVGAHGVDAIVSVELRFLVGQQLSPGLEAREGRPPVGRVVSARG